MADADVIASSARLEIRPWRPQEADRLFDMCRRWEVVRWIGGVAMPDRAVALERIELYRDRISADPRFGSWAVVERGHPGPAGTMLLKPLPDGEGEVEIGWHLHPDSWGRGLATEAAGLMLSRAFNLGLEEVWAVTDLENQRSASVCAKIGMRQLGLTHRWYHDPMRMFWVGSRPGQEPSLAPDGPLPEVATPTGEGAPGRAPRGV
jgi:RimJ/RimL family protein N-acetyltransferase